MVEPEKHNWPKIIDEICIVLRDPLRANSTGTKKLCEMMGCQYTQVKQWRMGQRVSHFDGEKLLTIHRSLYGSTTTSVV